MEKRIRPGKRLVTVLGLSLIALNVTGQTEQKYTLDEICQHAMENNQALKLSAGNMEVADQQLAVSRQAQLPNLNLSLSAFYLGDATIYSKDFSDKNVVEMPHFGNSLIVQANQLLYKGGAVRNSIAIASLQKQMASLDFEKNKQDIKLLISSYYLEILKLRHQKSIFEKNIKLASIRLHNIEKMYEQGMVTNNDVIRTRLLISNLEQGLLQVANGLEILNNQLVVATGLPQDVVIVPDETLLTQIPTISNLETYRDAAIAGHFNILKAQKSSEIAEKALKIAKSDRIPSLSLFAANSLQRPITSSTPALDMYTNGWQAGGSLSFNLSSLYKAPKSIKLSKLQLEQSKRNEVLQQQNTEIAVNTAYLKHQEAKKQLETTTVNMELASENYKIIEKKYLNQLAILVDMLDASQAKVESELQHTNATVNVIFSYYKLLNTTGNL